MNFVADESVDGQIVESLRNEGHQVAYVAEFDAGIEDEAVLSRAVELGARLSKNCARAWTYLQIVNRKLLSVRASRKYDQSFRTSSTVSVCCVAASRKRTRAANASLCTSWA